ncbi:MAG: hypothetical protein JXA90_15955 [Planctomycetes bacterium]|nr:hypothetical protein [Planctomycetota bacterium]
MKASGMLRSGGMLWAAAAWILAGGPLPALPAQSYPDFDLRVDCDGATLDAPFGARVILGTRESSDLQRGVQGWTLSIAATGRLAMVSATTAGTAGGDASAGPPGLRQGGFEMTQIVDPDSQPLSGPLAGLGPQGQGAVSAVVLSFTEKIALPPEGDSTLLLLTAEFASQGALCTSGSLKFLDGLQGSGQPVVNAITYSGETRRDDGGLLDNDSDGAEHCWIRIGDCQSFQRGDCNGQGGINLTDAVFGLNYLFLAGREPPCIKACDTNDDAAFNLTDSIVVLQYLFLGGPPPSAPFPACGEDPTPDALTCNEPPEACS